MPESTSATEARSWRRFLALFATIAGCGTLVVWLFVVLVDPFGRLPVSFPFDRGPVDGNARYAFPMLARDARFDSVILGTSTVRLLRPVALDPLLDAKFANLGMNSATPYEQSRLLEVFLATHPAPRLVLFGVDTQWCEIAASSRHFTERPFPEWLYSGSSWRGYREMADLYGIEKAGQAFAEWTGLKPRVYGRDGYTRFVPDDSRYDPARVAVLMRNVEPYAPPSLSGTPDAWPMPGSALMAQAIATIPSATRVILLFVPVNRRLIAVPGTPAQAVLDECKRRVVAIAAARDRTTMIDFMFASPITLHDENYWDPWHYRVGIAERIAHDVAAALRGERSEDYHVLWPRHSALVSDDRAPANAATGGVR